MPAARDVVQSFTQPGHLYTESGNIEQMTVTAARRAPLGGRGDGGGGATRRTGLLRASGALKYVREGLDVPRLVLHRVLVRRLLGKRCGTPQKVVIHLAPPTVCHLQSRRFSAEPRRA